MIDSLIAGDLHAMAVKIPNWFKDHPSHADIEPDTSYILANFLELYHNKYLTGSVLYEDGGIVGCLLGIQSMDIFEPVSQVTEVMFYIQPEYRNLHAALNLFKHFEATCFVDRLVFGISSGYQMDRIKKLYKYLGFVEKGGAFYKEL